ncbi:MAG: release factor glutamine methyltransferase [Candidatus Hydrogenedentota bacterium]
MSTLAQHLHEATATLTPVTETPRFDAELLLAHALGWTRTQLLTRQHEEVHVPVFDGYIQRRLRHEPIAYILESWEFFAMEFRIQPPLLVPRPETEHLVEAVVSFVGARPLSALDLCTGTGCVACAVARHATAIEVVATDISPIAVRLARENAERHGLGDRIQVRQGDLYTAVPSEHRRFDVIMSNPPYVEDAAWAQLSQVIRMHEDPRALFAGADGLDVIWRIVLSAPKFIRPGGLLAMEVGMGQANRVTEMMRARGFVNLAVRKDLAGIDRIVQGCWPE